MVLTLSWAVYVSFKCHTHTHTHTKYSTYLLFVVKGNIFIILGTLCAVQNVKYAHVAVLVVTIMFLLSVLHTHALLHILHFMLTAENILFITYSSLFIYSIFLSFFFSCAVFNCHVKLLASSIFPGQYVSNLISKRVNFHSLGTYGRASFSSSLPRFQNAPQVIDVSLSVLR